MNADAPVEGGIAPSEDFPGDPVQRDDVPGGQHQKLEQPEFGPCEFNRVSFNRNGTGHCIH